MYEINILDLSSRGITECHHLLSQVYSAVSHLMSLASSSVQRQFTVEYLDWQYNQNPLGKAVGFNAYYEQELVAHYVTLPIVANLFGRETRGLLSLNTATRQDHQGKKLFTTLAAKTYEYAKENGYDFVIGVANANSTPGLIGKLGFQLVCPLGAKVGIGSVVRKIEKRSALDFERIWDRDSLAWRTNNPVMDYHYARKENQIMIFASTGKFGIQAILGEYDADLCSVRPERVFKAAAPLMLKLWMGVGDHMDWSRSFSFDIPARLRPSPLNLIFKDLTGEARKLDREKVIFHAIDFDPY